MVKMIRLLMLVAVVCSVCQSCEMKEPLDDDVEGFWRLERFETAADGETHECDRIYYSITRYVVEVAERQGSNGYGSYIGRFSYAGGGSKAVMKDFKQRAATSDNGVDATVEQLLPFGMNATETMFEIVVADGDNLVLRSDYAVLWLTRF